MLDAVWEDKVLSDAKGRRNRGRGSAPEPSDGGPLESLTKLFDALFGVVAAAVMADTAELVAVQTALESRQTDQWVCCQIQPLFCGDAIGRGAHQLSYGAAPAFETLAQLDEALSRVGAVAFFIHATDRAEGQTARALTCQKGVLAIVQEVIKRLPAYSSFLSTAFPLMQEAMMIIQADVIPPGSLIDSTGLDPMSSSIGNG